MDESVRLTWEGAQRLGLTRYEFDNMTQERHEELLMELIMELYSKGVEGFLN